MIHRKREIESVTLNNCHNGEGALECFKMLQSGDSEKFSLFHFDILPQGTSIGEHPHTNNEEIYYLVSGKCQLIYDGQIIEMEPGDFSLVTKGHSHGLINTGKEDAKLIVVGA